MLGTELRFKINFGMERIYFQVIIHHWLKSELGLNAGTTNESCLQVHYLVVSLTMLVSILKQLRTTCLRMVPPAIAWILIQQTEARQFLIDMPTDETYFLSWSFCFRWFQAGASGQLILPMTGSEMTTSRKRMTMSTEHTSKRVFLKHKPRTTHV